LSDRRAGRRLRRRCAQPTRRAARRSVRLRSARAQWPRSAARADRNAQVALGKAARGCQAAPAAERGDGRDGGCRLPLRARAGARGHRLQAPRLVLSLWSLARLDHEQITTSLDQVVCIDGKAVTTYAEAASNKNKTKTPIQPRACYAALPLPRLGIVFGRGTPPRPFLDLT